ncbi:PAS domain S-box protein [Arcicella rosea]|uniref:histidine kinase n=1 Tax=Arcicella rosea TaxID=502909 RepID=A0A841EGD6_9BACT|nr:PAS domain S-box protein [Arcicella rosea]MBB6003257.1 PAS domain S-box-containing protein [Arcicella rosea]
MEDSRIPSNEILRLAALKELNILDTPAEQDFEDIVTLAIQISGASIAIISLMDSNRQWFKAKIGTDLCEISRKDSFCEHMIQNDSFLIVEDTTADERFKNNKFVTGSPNVLFYLGVPIKNQQGYILGSLCILHSKKLALNHQQIKSLEILARQAASLFNKKSELIYSEKILSTYVNNTLDSIILLDKDKKIIDSNKVFQERAKKLLNKEYRKGESIFEYSHPSIHPLIEKYFAIAILGEEVETELFIPFQTAQNWYKVLFIPSKSLSDEVVGVVITLTNITKQKKYEKQLQALNEELNFHYTNSPLAVIKWDSDLIIKSWSGQAEVIFGWEASEIVEKSFNEINLIHESDLEHVKVYADEMLSGTISRLTSKNKNITKSGEVIYCNWHNSILMDENGKVISIISLVENVTDVINITKALEIKTNNYEALINSTDDIIWSIDTDYLLMTANNAFIQNLLADSGELYRIGDSVFKESIPEAISIFWKEIYDRIFLGKSFATNFSVPNSNPNVPDKSFEIKANPIFKNNVVVAAALSLSDVSEKRIAEQKLSESEANLQAIFETTDTGYILINKSLEVLSFNKIANDISSQNFFNVGKVPTNGTPILDYFPIERRPILQKMMQEVLNGKRLEYEISFLQPNNTTNWYFVRLYPILSKKDQNYGLVMALSDITERKLANEQLKQSEMMFSDLAKNSPGIVFQFCVEPDGSSYFSYISDKGKKTFGFQVNDKNWQQNGRINQKERNAFFESINQAIIHQKDWNYEGEMETKDGKRKWFQGLASPTIKDGKIIYNGISLDITERKIAEEDRKNLRKLELSLAKEKEINNLKSRFISLTSHEFRTPITAIVSSVDILDIHSIKIGNQELQSKIKEHINKILFQTSRLDTMLKDILTIEKTAGGKILVKPQPLDLHKFLYDLNEQYYVDRKDGRKLKLILPEKIREIMTDPSLLSHVISNLINNAFKYSIKAQNPELLVEYHTDFYSITIKDYGIGIPLEEQEHLFETFFRANNVQNIEGTGLGLTITKEFTQKLGGNLSFISKPFEGSAFTIKLPYNL